MAMEDESLLEQTDRPNLFALIGALISGASLTLLGCSCNPVVGFLFIPIGGILSSIGLLSTWQGFKVAQQTGRGRDLSLWGAYLGVLTLLTWTGLTFVILAMVLGFATDWQ